MADPNLWSSISRRLRHRLGNIFFQHLLPRSVDPQTWQVGPWDHERYRIEFPHYIHYIVTTSLQYPTTTLLISPHHTLINFHHLSSSFIIFHLQFATSSGELFVTMAFAHLQSELLPKPSAHGKVPQARCIWCQIDTWLCCSNWWHLKRHWSDRMW